MRKVIRILAVIIGVLLMGALLIYWLWIYNPYEDKLLLNPSEVFSESSSSNQLLIRNATLIDVMGGRTIPDAHILIRGDSIAGVFVGEEPAAEGVTTYDVENKYIMPGLIDVHVHLSTYWHLISGDFAPRDSLVTKAALEQFVRYGVTSVLALGGGGANNEQIIKLKQQERDNRIISPWLFGVGNLFTAPGSHPITTIMRLSPKTSQERLNKAGVTAITNNSDIPALVKNKKKLGLDGVKIILESGPPPFYPNPRMSKTLAAEIVEQAGKLKLPVFAHTESYEEFTDAIALDVHGVMHSVMDTLLQDPQLIEIMKRKNIWYVPTLSIFYGFQFLEYPERLEDEFLQSGVSKRNLKSYEHPLFRFGFGQSIRKFDVSKWLETSTENLLRMYSEGVPIAMGTDASTPFNFPGYGAHLEMELMARAGIPNADVLRMSTINGARFLGVDDQIGTINTGKIANLLILNENPLVDIRHTRTIQKVILKGHLIDPGFE